MREFKLRLVSIECYEIEKLDYWIDFVNAMVNQNIIVLYIQEVFTMHNLIENSLEHVDAKKGNFLC